MAVGMFLLSRLDVDTSTWSPSLDMIVLGLGLGMVMQVLVLAVQNAVEHRMLGVATSARRSSARSAARSASPSSVRSSPTVSRVELGLAPAFECADPEGNQPADHPPADAKRAAPPAAGYPPPRPTFLIRDHRAKRPGCSSPTLGGVLGHPARRRTAGLEVGGRFPERGPPARGP